MNYLIHFGMSVMITLKTLEVAEVVYMMVDTLF